MKTWIALLRGINVGGRNTLRMSALRETLESLGLARVRTYLQSGNAVFDMAEDDVVALATRIEDSIEADHGFRPQTLILSGTALERTMLDNPFPAATADPASLHVFFLALPAVGFDAAGLESAAAGDERYRLTDRAFYLHAPNGIGRSTLAKEAERLLGVAATARNWRTVVALSNLAAGACLPAAYSAKGAS